MNKRDALAAIGVVCGCGVFAGGVINTGYFVTESTLYTGISLVETLAGLGLIYVGLHGLLRK